MAGKTRTRAGKLATGGAAGRLARQAKEQFSLTDCRPVTSRAQSERLGIPWGPDVVRFVLEYGGMQTIFPVARHVLRDLYDAEMEKYLLLQMAEVLMADIAGRGVA